MQAGGRRFDPGTLHGFTKRNLTTETALHEPSLRARSAFSTRCLVSRAIASSIQPELVALFEALEDESAEVRIAAFEALTRLPLAPSDWHEVASFMTRVQSGPRR